MAEIEKLIPNYPKLRKDMKDKTGQTLSYYKGLIEGCSIGHYVPAYNYDDYYHFDVLKANSTEMVHPNVSADVTDFNAPQSLFFWYKQMDDKCQFKFKERSMPDHPADPSVEPIQYFLETPITQKVPSTDSFKDWPLKQRPFLVDFDYVPQNPHMFQPKRTFHHEENLDFWVSPRMHIRYIRGWLTGVLYCDTFQIETILIAKEVGGPWNSDGVNKPYGIEFEMRVRL